MIEKLSGKCVKVRGTKLQLTCTYGHKNFTLTIARLLQIVYQSFFIKLRTATGYFAWAYLVLFSLTGVEAFKVTVYCTKKIFKR